MTAVQLIGEVPHWQLIREGFLTGLFKDDETPHQETPAAVVVRVTRSAATGWTFTISQHRALWYGV